MSKKLPTCCARNCYKWKLKLIKKFSSSFDAKKKNSNVERRTKENKIEINRFISDAIEREAFKIHQKRLKSQSSHLEIKFESTTCCWIRRLIYGNPLRSQTQIIFKQVFLKAFRCSDIISRSHRKADYITKPKPYNHKMRNSNNNQIRDKIKQSISKTHNYLN